MHVYLRRLCLFSSRLEPVIIELERQRAPVVVISHQVIHHLILSPNALFFTCQIDLFGIFQAVLRALYAYFADRPLKEIPHIEVIYVFMTSI